MPFVCIILMGWLIHFHYFSLLELFADLEFLIVIIRKNLFSVLSKKKEEKQSVLKRKSLQVFCYHYFHVVAIFFHCLPRVYSLSSLLKQTIARKIIARSLWWHFYIFFMGTKYPSLYWLFMFSRLQTTSCSTKTAQPKLSGLVTVGGWCMKETQF